MGLKKATPFALWQSGLQHKSIPPYAKRATLICASTNKLVWSALLFCRFDSIVGRCELKVGEKEGERGL